MDPTSLPPNQYAQLWFDVCQKEVMSRTAARQVFSPARSESELTTWGLTRKELPALTRTAGQLGWTIQSEPTVCPFSTASEKSIPQAFLE